jgi:hypothetical protein
MKEADDIARDFSNERARYDACKTSGGGFGELPGIVATPRRRDCRGARRNGTPVTLVEANSCGSPEMAADAP